MARIIDISGKLSKEKPVIIAEGKEYIVNDGLNVVIKYEELVSTKTFEGVMKAIELSLGKDAVKELGVASMSVSSLKVLSTAIMAAMQDISYEDAEARFPENI